MNTELRTTCCIAGGGPAGMMIGFLLARAGIEVIVLEKHADFFRDFRGDTIHPSTFSLMSDMGLLEAFLQIPHDEVTELSATFDGAWYKVADFSHVPAPHKVLGFMPQWDFLNFLLEQSKKYPSFHLMPNTTATGIVRDGNKVTGVKIKTEQGESIIHASLVVAADGRGSAISAAAGLVPVDLGAPMDVLWFRLSRTATDPEEALLSMHPDNIFISIRRKDYYQCGYVIPKGGFDKLKGEGLQRFKERLVVIMPYAKERMDELKSWDDIKLLSVSVSHLQQWAIDGLLCIGDAAHTMSPIGGVGINLAVQDAVAAANILYQPLKDNKLTLAHLNKVQARRSFPSRMVQRMQVTIQNNVISPAITGKNKKVKPPLFIKVLQYFPLLRRLLGRLVGMGIRPEHVRTPEVK